jgi:hypothetical protein
LYRRLLKYLKPLQVLQEETVESAGGEGSNTVPEQFA